MASPGKQLARTVKPLLSLNNQEARLRVLGLYKAWIRQARFLGMDFDIPRSEKQIRERIRYHFLKNQHIQDVRVIDMLVIKGQMELRETVNRWKTTTAIMLYFNDTHEPKPSSFLGKFMAGQD